MAPTDLIHIAARSPQRLPYAPAPFTKPSLTHPPSSSSSSSSSLHTRDQAAIASTARPMAHTILIIIGVAFLAAFLLWVLYRILHKRSKRAKEQHILASNKKRNPWEGSRRNTDRIVRH
ncbi:hypothetical protein MKZ38_006591 [Zalerion maritima]|uniref:Transmembrane protein n=1 Tax=Zalerion maritima TaxID=339359 RepID=A0AAD5RNW3_9PEZI|nr:hypothetical protein MKZ38_006591 [Zalerion maritima]